MHESNHRSAEPGTEEISRVTTRHVRLPDDIALRPPSYSWERDTPATTRRFRPTLLVEKLVQGPDGNNSTWTVRVTGPTQTKTGKDHAVNYGDRQYTVRDIPAVLVPFTIGADAMAEPLS